MKKVVFIVQVLILLLFVLTSCRKKEPVQKVWLSGGDWLNGNVKEIFMGDNKYFNKDFFDEKGNLVYTMSRDLSEWEDKDGKHSKVDSQKIIYSSMYNELGNKIAIMVTIAGDSTHKAKYEFDKSGRMIDFIPDITDTPYLCKGHFKYDNKGDLIEDRQDFCTHRASDIRKYKYDNNHMVIEMSHYEDEVLEWTTGYKYLRFDSHKNWTTRILHTQYSSFMKQSPRIDTVARKITYY